MRGLKLWKYGIAACAAITVVVGGLAIAAAPPDSKGKLRGKKANAPSTSAHQERSSVRTDAVEKAAAIQARTKPGAGIPQDLRLELGAMLAKDMDPQEFVPMLEAKYGVSLGLDMKSETLASDVKLLVVGPRTQAGSAPSPGGSVAGGGVTCAAALAIGEGTFLGVTAGDPDDAGDGPSPTCGLQPPSGIDDWYAYTVSCPPGGVLGTATASLCGAGSAFEDSVIAVFTDCVGGQLACDDDGCTGPSPPAGNGFMSTTSWTVADSSTYIIRVSGWGTTAPDDVLTAYQLDVSVICPVCGNGTVEAPEQCDPPGPGCNAMCQFTGACCIKDAPPPPLCLCSDLTPADCALAGGVYRGNGTVCGGMPDICDCNTNGICDQNDLLPSGGTERDDLIDIDPDIVVPTTIGQSPCGACPPATPVCVDVNDDGIIGPAPDRCGSSHTFNVMTNGTIFDVDVDVDLTHSFEADLIIIVEHGGVEVTLMNGVDGTGNDLGGVYLFDDAAAADLDTAAGPIIAPGTYSSDELLAQFNGQDKFGPWTIYIADDAGADGGPLRGWSLHILNDAIPPVGTDCNMNGILDSCEGINPLTGACCTGLVCAQALPAACMGVGQTFFGTCTLCADVVCPACGNGITEPGEACDDGNAMNGDGCSSLCQCEVVPNDTCITRDNIDPVPISPAVTSAQDNNQCALDDVTAFCGTSTPNQGVWYNVTGDGNTYTATTCHAGMGTDYDTMIQVTCDDCVDMLCVGGNDDQAGAFVAACETNLPAEPGINRGSTFSWCTKPGRVYKILVGGFSAFSGNHLLTVTSDGVACAGAISCDPPVGACCEPDGMCTDGLTAGTCALLPGVYQGDGTLCATLPLPCPVCGNGILEGAEECDDGDMDNGDGCSDACLCEAGPPANDLCANRIDIFNGVTFFNTNGALTDGPAHATCQFAPGQTFADIWFNYDATCTGNLTVSTCGTVNYDSDIVIYDAGADCDAADCAALSDPPLGCNDDGVGCAGFSSLLTVPVTSGNCYKIRIGGFDDDLDTGCGTVEITCAVCGDGMLNVGEECDDGDLDDGDGCSSTCQLEGACCTSVIAGSACSLKDPAACTAANGNYQGDGTTCTGQCDQGACCVGTLGECQEVSAACCADQGGVYEGGTTCAAVNCPCDVVCAPGKTPEGEADCGLPTDTVNGGCNSPSFPTASNCCVAHAGTGCDDAGCQAAVCLIDAFCCATAWDDVCAGEAQTECPAQCAPTFDLFSPIACPSASYCGTSAFDTGLGLRDTDWYKLVVGVQTEITWKVTAEFDSLVGILDTGGVDACPVAAFLASATGAPCQEVVVTACVDPGTWYLFVAPQFLDEVLCGAQYNAELACAACGGGGGVDPMADACADRISIGDGTRTFDLTGMTEDGVAEPACVFPFGDDQIYKDIWYNYTAPCNGLLRLDTCGSGGHDTRVAVYDCGAGPTCAGCACPPAGPIDCNDDSGAIEGDLDPDTCLQGGANPPFESALEVPVIAGNCYKIRVGAFDPLSSTGLDELHVACVLPPTGACCVPGSCTCSVETPGDCATMGGFYHGDGSTCGASECDCNMNGVCDELDLAPGGGTERMYMASPALPIPDSPAPGITHVINVAANGIIFDVDVDVDISHTFISDLFITVTHNATTVVLWDNGCGGDVDLDVIFDDAGAAVVCASPTVGTITTTGLTAGLLAAFNGQDKFGDWTISVTDQVGADVGTLNAWSLHILNDADPPFSQDCNGDGIPDDCQLVPDCNMNGIPDDCELAGNDMIPPCGNGIPDDCEPQGCPCVTAADCKESMACHDDNACNCAACIAGICVWSCTVFGDVDCLFNGVDVGGDILCVLAGFASFGNCPGADINPCGGNGVIDLDDILDVLNAFGGANPCGCNAGGVPPLCGSIAP